MKTTSEIAQPSACYFSTPRRGERAVAFSPQCVLTRIHTPWK